MWFRQLSICPFTQSIEYKPDELDRLLQTQQFSPCTALAPVRAGFVPPIGDDADAPLLFCAEQRMLMCIQVQHKVLPKAVLREQHLIKVKKIENQLGNKLPYAEKKRIKEELEHTLLGQAFNQSSRFYAYIDVRRNRLVINTTNKKRLELFFKLFTPLINPNQVDQYTLHAPSDILTDWLSDHHIPSAFSILDRCVLEQHDENKGTIRLNKIDLFTDAMQQFITDGSHVAQLGLNWDDRIIFQLKKDFSISGVQYLDSVKELAQDGMRETEADRFATDFFIMTETLDLFFTELLNVFSAPDADEDVENTTKTARRKMTETEDEAIA